LCVECLCTVRARPVASEEGFSPDILRDRLYQHEFMHHLLFDPSTEERLLKFFYWLVERFGQVNSGKAILPVKLTHQDLAEFVGSTRVTVTRLLGQLEKRGKIQWSDRRHMELIIDNSEFAPRLRA
ncbi:MAG: Crp/Fnr family transcriptional regulator, partial [Cyanobacteria bacterium P01_F01_bin.33]